jgi:FkbM family methyltransferase
VLTPSAVWATNVFPARTAWSGTSVNVERLPTIVQNVMRTRRAFRNWLAICVVVGIAAPSSLPPRQGFPWLGRRRRRLVTRTGTVVETEAGNASPVIEVFAYGEYDLPLDWTGLHGVLDVGAHVGSFAFWTCERARVARIVSVEPEPRNFADLVSNIERNDLTSRIEPVNAALGTEPGTVTLHVPMNRESSSTLATGGESVQAVVVSLPELLERFDGQLDLLKLDAEGAEWAALAALDGETWAKIPRLVMECHAVAGRTVEEMIERLEQQGFAPRVLSRQPSGVSWCDEVALIWAERGPDLS